MKKVPILTLLIELTNIRYSFMNSMLMWCLTVVGRWLAVLGLEAATKARY